MSTTTAEAEALALALAGALAEADAGPVPVGAAGAVGAMGALVADDAADDDEGTASGASLLEGAPTDAPAGAPAATGPGHWSFFPQASGTPRATTTKIAESRRRWRMPVFYQNLRAGVFAPPPRAPELAVRRLTRAWGRPRSR
jgi:hypothetical protein